jgi:hypothetical protein
MMKRIALPILLIVSLLLAACAAPVAAPAGGEQGAAAPGEKVTLRALFMQQAGYQQGGHRENHRGVRGAEPQPRRGAGLRVV